jgi:hypothetical protein
MSWRESISIYCERGGDPAFWAEPYNAATNGAFLLAALLAFRDWRRAGRGAPGRGEGLLLILIVGAIGIGSFLFHTFAERWSALADIVPIGVFMLLYLGLALRRLLGSGLLVAGGAVLLFALVCASAMRLRCDGGPCLGGSVAYLPAAGALAIVAAVLAVRLHPARWLVGAAALVFPVSLTARTLDMPLCAATQGLGTHFLWHLLNALTLYLLVAAVLRHPGVPSRRA